MNAPKYHVVTLNLKGGQEASSAGVIEGTGLLLNTFVQGNSVRDQYFDYHIEEQSSHCYSIHANLRDAQSTDFYALSRIYARLYLVFVRWYLAGADVEISGEWAKTFPGEGRLSHNLCRPLKLTSVFEDELAVTNRTDYPELSILAEIHDCLRPGVTWNELKVSPRFTACFNDVVGNSRSKVDFLLTHKSGLRVDLVLQDGLVTVHILKGDQFTARNDLSFLECQREVSPARTWWDAWIGHCGTSSLLPRQLQVLPDEIAVCSSSICRYRLQDAATLEQPLSIYFGPGFHPTRSVGFWLQLANRFGASGFVNVAAACSEQAIKSATALVDNPNGLAFGVALGKSAKEELNEAEVEHLRWVEAQRLAEHPRIVHDKWNSPITIMSVRRLVKRLGEPWQQAMSELVDAIDLEHNDSHDQRRKIGRVSEVLWRNGSESGSLRYCRIWGSQLMSAKVPRAALAKLGYQFTDEGIPTHLEVENIFQLRLSNLEFWGSVEHRVLIDCEDPTRVYRI